MDTENLDNQKLDKQETREFITPYAFNVANQMLGVPLASPTRRLVAMIIDVTMIFGAAKISATIIAFIAALAFYKSTGKMYLSNMSQFSRRILKFTSTIILFFAASALLGWTVDNLTDDGAMTVQVGEQFTEQEINAISQYLEQTDDKTRCDDSCQQKHFNLLLQQVPKLQDEFSNEINQDKDFEQLMLKLLLLTHNNDSENLPDTSHVAENIDHEPSALTPEKNNKTYSLLEWSKGILTDLGLGFGWAAIYFTLFPVLWKGQTLGKKLCGIRVIGLDGSYLSLWDAFGRYGGYGAGFATGLLGFLQIYWDPNRQAIQDKISATVVIKGDLPKLDIEKFDNETDFSI